MVRVRFSSAELALAKARARADGVPLSTFLRRLAVTARFPAESEPRVKRALAAFDALSAEDVSALRREVRQVREAWDRGRR